MKVESGRQIPSEQNTAALQNRLNNEVRHALNGLHDEYRYLANPFRSVSCRYLGIVKNMAHELDEHAREVGRLILDDLLVELPDETREKVALEVGARIVRVYHHDLIRRHEEELALWKARDWAALRREGHIDDEAYFTFVSELSSTGSPSER